MALDEIRQKLSLVATTAKALKRLRDAGILDLGDVGMTLETVKNSRIYGPQATLVMQGGRKYPSLPAVVDERGTLTYKQVDDMSTALARGLKQRGITSGSVVGLLCRDHRGLILAMAACGKLGARFVSDEHGLRQTAVRAGLRAGKREARCCTTVSSSDLLEALPAHVARVLSWVDEDVDPGPSSHY